MADAQKTVDTGLKCYGSIVNLATTGSLSKKSTEKRRADGEIVDYQNRAVRLAADGGAAEVVVKPNNVVIAANQNCAIGVTDNTIVLHGRVSMTNSPDNLIINGFWRLNEELLTTLPSTLMNPIETLIYKYPPYVKKMAKLIMVCAGG
jgi:hypothetical protein